MKLLERLDEILQTLNEAKIDPRQLSGNKWNDAYLSLNANQGIEVHEDEKLYRVVLYTKRKSNQEKKDTLNSNALGNDRRYLQLLHGQQTINKSWLHKNAGTAEFGAAYSPQDATLFKLPANDKESRDSLIDILRTHKARKALSYNRVELEEVTGPDLQRLKNDDNILSEPQDFDKPKLIQWYLTSLFSVINSKDPGESIASEYPYSGNTISPAAAAFYKKYLSSDTAQEAYLDNSTMPLWHNEILTVASYLCVKTKLMPDDLMIRAAMLSSHVTSYSSNPCITCYGPAFELAANPGFVDYSPTQFEQSIQLAYNILNRSGSGIVNSRLLNAKESIKKATVVSIFSSNADNEQFKKLHDYLFAENGRDHLKEEEISGISSLKLNEIPLNSFNTVKSNAISICTTEIEGAEVLNVFLGWRTAKATVAKAMEYTDVNLYQLTDESLAAFIKMLNSEKTDSEIELFVKGSDNHLLDIKAVTGVHGTLNSNGIVKVRVDELKNIGENNLSNIFFNTETKTLSFGSMENTIPQEVSRGAQESPWANWEKDHEAGSWDSDPEDTSSEEEGK